MSQVFEYGGYEMRSHSETRWASMMDYCGIRWLYEPRTYRTRHGGYLPDFYLPDAQCFLEVKGPHPTAEEIEKAKDLEEVSGYPVIFAYGSPRLDGIYLGNGFLVRDHVRVSTYELSQGMEKMYGMRYAACFANSGRIHSAPCCFDLDTILDEMMRGWMGRNVVEKMRREKHAPLNAAKLESFYAPTYPAALVTACIVRVKNWMSQDRRI